MQTPAFLALRALVMLATLVAVPMAALFWKSVPSCVDQFLARCEDRLGISLTDPTTWADPGKSRRAEDRLGLMEAPRFEARAVQTAGTDWIGGGAAPRPMPAGPASKLPTPEPLVADSGEVRASYQVPAAARRGGAGSADAQRGAMSMFSSTSAGSPRTEDPFTLVQHRLKELGATYYLLESWGADGAQYRFHCQMAVAGSERYSRQFEVIADDPLTAMRRVLSSVEDWKAGRQP